MAVNPIRTKKLATNNIAKQYKVDPDVGFALLRVTGLNDVFIYFDNEEKSEAFLVPRDKLLPVINVNSNILRFYSTLPSELSVLSWG